MDYANEEVTEKIGLLQSTETDSDKAIPSWGELQGHYESRWQKEKAKFQVTLKAKFFVLVERFASGKQEIFVLTVSERREKRYINAFLEIFESGYAPHVGDVERVANKRCRKLYVTLPSSQF